MVTQIFAANLMLLIVTSITSSVSGSHYELEEVPKLLLGLSELEWVLPTVISVSLLDFVTLCSHVWPVISLTWIALMCVPQTCLSGLFR